MRTFLKKLKYAYKLMTAKRLIFVWVENDPDETMDWTSFNLKPEEIPLFCDLISIDVTDMMREYRDNVISESVGRGMINFVNLN